MKKDYFTLFVQDVDTLEWYDMFGSFEYAAVQEEREMYAFNPSIKKTKILSSDGTHEGLMANYEAL